MKKVIYLIVLMIFKFECSEAQTKIILLVNKQETFSNNSKSNTLIKFIFDKRNRIISKTKTVDNKPVNEQFFSYQNNMLTKVVEVEGKNKTTSTYAYNSNGRIKREVSIFLGTEKIIKDYSYDGNVVCQTESMYRKEKLVHKIVEYNEYSSMNKISKKYVINENNDTIFNNMFFYDAKGNLIREKNLKTEKRYEYIYDNNDSLTQVKNYINGILNKKYLYTYENFKQEIVVTDSIGNILNEKYFMYYPHGGLAKSIFRNGSSSNITYYNANGGIKTQEVYFEDKVYSIAKYEYVNPHNLPLPQHIEDD